MSAFSGKQHKGAMREHRKQKKTEAESRNAKTPPERTRNYRRHWEGMVITLEVKA